LTMMLRGVLGVVIVKKGKKNVCGGKCMVTSEGHQGRFNGKEKELQRGKMKRRPTKQKEKSGGDP